MPTTSRPSSSEVDVALPTREFSPEAPAGDATVAVPAAGPAVPGGAPASGAESRGTVPDAGTRGASPSAAALPPGPFGRYRIERLLGRGAMGAVYLARDTELQRFVALKVPLFDAQATPAQVERFFREARSAAVLNHPGICPVYDVGEHDGIRFLAMAYIEGRPLSDYVQPGRLQPERHVALVVRKLALALQAAHDKGIVHRDLKPGNVMIDSRNEPIVMDFGLALRFDDSSQATLTQEGTVVGTPAYMAPEQLSSRRELGPACDIWALGVILYELLTGLRPFQGPVVTIIAGILHEAPRPVTELRFDISPTLAEICHRALAKDPAQRFASMNDFALALADFLKGQTAPSAPPATQPQGVPTRAPEPSRTATPPRTRTIAPSPATRAIAASPAHDTAWDDDLLAEAEALPPVARRSKPRSSKAKASGGDRNALWFVLGGIAATVVVLGLVLAFTWGRTPRASEPPSPSQDEPASQDPVEVAGGPGTPSSGSTAPSSPDGATADDAPPKPAYAPTDPLPTGPATDPAPTTSPAGGTNPPQGTAATPNLGPAGSTNPPPDTLPPTGSQNPVAATPAVPPQPPATSGTNPRPVAPGSGGQPTDGSRIVPELSADEHFANHDRNGDGSLFPTEIPPHIIDRCDANNDRRLSRTEFRKGFEKFGAKLFDPPEGPGIGGGPPNGPMPPQPGGPRRPRRPN